MLVVVDRVLALALSGTGLLELEGEVVAVDGDSLVAGLHGTIVILIVAEEVDFPPTPSAIHSAQGSARTNPTSKRSRN